MHQDHQFLKRIGMALSPHLKGLEWIEAFVDQGTGTAYLGFASPHSEQWLGFVQQPAIQTLIFPEHITQYGKRTKPLFPELKGKKVENIFCELARSYLIIHLQDGWDLMVKLKGKHSALALYASGELKDSFCSLAVDDDLPHSLPSETRSPKTIFQEEGADFLYRWLGRAVMRKEQIQPEHADWQALDRLAEKLEKAPLLYICRIGDAVALRFWQEGMALERTREPLQAANLFWKHCKETAAWKWERQEHQKQLKKSLRRLRNSVAKTRDRLQALAQVRFKEKADILMANLYQVPKGASEITLFDFYQNKEITLPLNPTLSPQKQAEKLYKKAKGQHIEEQHLKATLQKAERKILQQEASLADLKKVDSTEGWEWFKSEHGL